MNSLEELPIKLSMGRWLVELNWDKNRKSTALRASFSWLDPEDRLFVYSRQYSCPIPVVPKTTSFTLLKALTEITGKIWGRTPNEAKDVIDRWTRDIQYRPKEVWV